MPIILRPALVYSDEHQSLLSVEANRTSLGPACRLIFDAGLERRGL